MKYIIDYPYQDTLTQLAQLATNLYTYGQSHIGNTGMTILILAAGITLYAAIVGSFYLKLSKKVLYDVNFTDKTGHPKSTLNKILNILSFILRYTLVFPAITTVWFIILSTLIYLLSRTLTISTAFIIAISVVLSIRVCAYYKEEIAVDLAKMLPLAMLGVLLIEPTQFNPDLVNERLIDLFLNLPAYAQYITAIIATEWTLRILLAVKRIIKPPTEKK